jgi:hypothetical protein
MTYIDECLYLYRNRTDSESLGGIPAERARMMHTAAYLEFVAPCYRRWIEDEGLFEIRLEDRLDKAPVESGCVGLMLTSRSELPWDEVFRVMAPGGAVLVDHRVDGGDPRFQRYHRSEAGTHFICLKPPYSDRPVGAPSHVAS